MTADRDRWRPLSSPIPRSLSHAHTPQVPRRVRRGPARLLPVVGRRRPGDRLRFVGVSVEEAEEIAREEDRRLSRLVEALEPVSNGNAINLGSLYGNNLISGVVTGLEGSALK